MPLRICGSKPFAYSLRPNGEGIGGKALSCRPNLDFTNTAYRLQLLA